MIKIEDKKNCCGCTACKSICPVNAIEMVEDEEGFKYPVVDLEKCINCGQCERVCQYNKENTQNKDIKVYAAKNKNLDVVTKSSSGGMFHALAASILDDNGIVVGASYNEDNMVEHIIIDDIKDLYKLMGSKYVQSNLNGIYRKVKEILKEKDKKVLFSGTPCQILGLNMFLGKEYENLYTVDIICHGVPSTLAYTKYTKYMEEKYNSKINTINFRSKVYKGETQTMEISFKNNKKYISPICDDIFYKLFLQNKILRPSCYNCHANNFRSKSDITIADYWGIQNVHPEFYSEKGNSVIIVKTEKGHKLFNNIKEKIDYIETDIKNVEKYNKNLINSCEVNYDERKLLIKDLIDMDFKAFIHKYNLKTNPLIQTLRKIKRNIKSR